MASKVTYGKDKIRFDDGARGFQRTAIHPDGRVELLEVVITRDCDGERCREVYAQRCDLMARVYSLSDLHGRSWAIAKD